MNDFFRTIMGRKLIESTLPGIREALEAVAKAAQVIADKYRAGPMVSFDTETTYRVPPWENNQLQFARLLMELEANANDLCLDEVAGSMDLSLHALESIFARARTIWEAHLLVIRLFDEAD